GDQEIFTRAELIEKFDWSHVGKTPAQYDLKKFEYVQATHLRALSDEDLARQARAFLAPELVVDSEERLVKAVGTVKTRAITLVDVAQMVDFYFRDLPRYDHQAVAKHLVPGVVERLTRFRAYLETQKDFDRKSLESSIRAWLTENGFFIKDIAQPARVALTGRAESPGLFEVLEVLGKERALYRLDHGIRLASQNQVESSA
ncbi:MAG: hypothetical protein NZM37_01670, partial [Sandaracinaceae bacterium]|nr:hypothetical protein [Sandaracinaceae bacterium]